MGGRHGELAEPHRPRWQPRPRRPHPRLRAQHRRGDHGRPQGFAIGLIGTLAIFGIAYGPVGAYLPEMFQTRYRYTGAGMGCNLGGVLGGAVAPLVAAQLTNSFGSYAVGIMIAALGLLSLACTLALGETRNRAIETHTADTATTGASPA